MCATDCGTTSDLKHPTPQSSDLLLESAYASAARSQLKSRAWLRGGRALRQHPQPLAPSVTCSVQKRACWANGSLGEPFPQSAIAHLEADVMWFHHGETRKHGRDAPGLAHADGAGCVWASASYTFQALNTVQVSVTVKNLPGLPAHSSMFSWGIPTRNVFLMTEQLQQLQGESLSNERNGKAPALAIARPPRCVDEYVCSGTCDLVVVIYGTDWGLCAPELEQVVAANIALQNCDPGWTTGLAEGFDPRLWASLCGVCMSTPLLWGLSRYSRFFLHSQDIHA